MQTEIRAMRREISLVLKLVLAVKLGRGYHLPLSLLLRYGFFGLFNERGGRVDESCLATRNNFDDLSGRQVHPGTEYGFSLLGRSCARFGCVRATVPCRIRLRKIFDYGRMVNHISS